MCSQYICRLQDINSSMYSLCGNKAANLGETKKIGIPVPEGFVLTTTFCNEYLKNHSLLDIIFDSILEHVKELEKKTGKKLGDPEKPLIVSVRTSPVIVMPGILATILNVGINDEIVESLSTKYSPSFAYAAYFKMLYSFGSAMKDQLAEKATALLHEFLSTKGYTSVKEANLDDIKFLIEKFKALFKDSLGKEFPQNPIDQLKLAIKLALESWTSRKAIEYRKKNRIPETIGMGVLIMEMKFGNINERSGAGVLFTRDPNTGENRLVGDFQISVQGDEIVLGKIVTLKLDELKEILPNAYNNLYEYSKKLERHFKDALDIEFTIEDGKVWILQVRSCRKTPEALVKILVDMVHEGTITREEAIANVDPDSLKELLYYRIDDEERRGAIEEGRLFCECIGASPGVGVGSLKFIPPLKPFSEKDVEGKILVFDELKPSYVMRLRKCEGIIVIRGGSSSHAIILARAIGKPVVILGDSNVLCDVSKGFLSNGVITLSENDEVTIDGLRGEIYIGMLYKKEPILIDEFYELVSYADEFSGAIEIRANVESPTDIRDLHEWNINKINVRTEIREIIYQFVTADTADEKREVLRRLLRIQKDFFKKFLNKFNSGIITFKLIDPPFHEFLPDLSPLLREFYYNLYAKKNHDPKLESLIKKVTSLHNRNPMLGFRGVRIGIVCPEIYLFQVRALLEALFEEGKTYNGDPKVRILIPNVINAKEFSYVRRIIEQAIENFNKRNYTQYDIPIGAVIETPASIINIVDISRHADFLVLGTNDLTQLILGMGRDDSEKFFLRDYIEKNLLSDNPFLKLDDSVVRFIENGLKELKQNNIDIEIGIAGEHSNDLDSVKKCIKLGIDYISVNSKIIPISKIIVAKAFLEIQKESS